MVDWTGDPLDALVEVVAVATLPMAAFAAVFLGGEAAAVVAIVGWFLLVPLLSVLSDHVELGTEASTESTANERADAGDDALQRLRDRYAAGELDDVEFERRLERLVETEDLEIRSDATLDGTDERYSDRPDGRRRGRERELE
ncbi:SHOCT domain-containing protein [Halosimplex salinum]|uniref:SHOCT domain-containing protein n=1 Tax=Halosimplex salinum TaxID=1710538 RepID=UPI0013DDA606|nr:SHOCT domain-containing protein [Halosimplex salinum]